MRSVPESGRDTAKLVRDRMRFAALEPGGSEVRPIEVVSASLVEVQARSMPCPVCGAAPVRVEDHTAILRPGASLRIAHVFCTGCGTRREIYFSILPVHSN